MADIALKLVNEGPVKQEPAKRRVRGLLGGQWIFDTLDAVYVWEKIYYPLYYVPLTALQTGTASLQKIDLGSAADGIGFWQGTLQSDKRGVSADITVFEKGPLAGLVKISAPASTLEWYAEDELLLGTHPKDPYKRVECLPSSREIRVETDGKILAKSTNSVFLHETGLRTRYYLSPTSVLDWSLFHPSDTISFCPYKGQASYYHLKVGDHEIRDAVWYYKYPTLESAQIQGLLSFYNEKFDVFVDGVKETR